MQNGNFQICSFAIPLITIVAFFVFQLFLPIVVFIFQLWFLLTLRFCIPPDVDLTGGFGAELDAIGGGLNINAGAVAAVQADPAFGSNMTTMLGGASYNGVPLSDAVVNAAKSLRAPDSIDPKSFASLLRGVFAARRRPPKASDVRQAGRAQRGGAAVTTPAATPPAVTTPAAGPDPLGTGWTFPPEAVTAGAFEWLSGAALVRQSILIILDTQPGERVMRPDFGCGLRRYLMEPNTPATRAAIAGEIQAALRAWEQRIVVGTVDVVPTDDPSTVLVSITYTLARDQSIDTVQVTVPVNATSGSQ